MIDGKVLQIDKEGEIIIRGNSLYRNASNRIVVKSKASIKKWKYALTSYFFLTRRLFRAEVTGLYNINESTILVAKKGLFLKEPDCNIYEKCFNLQRGSKPLNLSVLPNGHIFWGEYFQNIEKQSVHIYGSFDYGKTWQKYFSFEKGNVNHIHGVFFDKYTNHIWVTTGDRENECIIGFTEDEFKTFVEVFRGGQEYRTCQLFFYKDFIVFGTDSQYQQNVIKKFDRQTLEITELQKVQGSVIKGGQVGDVAFISTTVEPSKVNTDKYAHLWVTKDGVHWEERYKAKKDWLPATLFQFGTFEFPQYYGIEKLERLYFSGRALKGLDGKTTYIDL